MLCKLKPALFLFIALFAMISLHLASEHADAQILVPIRPFNPIRLGGVFTMGLAESGGLMQPSALLGTQLSNDNLKWIGDNCDAAAFSPNCLHPGIFQSVMQQHPLFTPLLYLYATSISEKPDQEGSVGGWNSSLEPKILLDTNRKDMPYPSPDGHWMDFGSRTWAEHWRKRAAILTQRYGVQGVVAAELPVNNTFLPEKPGKYPNFNSLASATEKWLQLVHNPNRYLLVAAALQFGQISNHPTLATPPGGNEPGLSGLLWNQYYPFMDGAWYEGWVRPYWTGLPVSANEWERQLEAADRAALNGQVFIANAAYHNRAELEYALASYLLVSHKQGRLVIQPMPLRKGLRDDAGFSLAVMRREVSRYSSYFNIPLGAPHQSRHLIAVHGGSVWRRAFDYGVVYVNADNYRTVQIALGAPMVHPDGEKVSDVTLPPHSGAILLYNTPGG